MNILDFLKNLLPTAGAVGGGLLGGIAAGGFGAVPGAGAGAAGGEVLRQLLSGQKIQPKNIRNEAAMGIAGESIGIPTGALFNKALTGGATKIMESVFKESTKKLAKQAVRTGTSLGKEALEKGEVGTAQQIYQGAMSKMSALEDALQEVISGTTKKINLSSIRESVQPLINKYTKAGNTPAVSFITKRLDDIETGVGKVINPVTAQQVKRTLYEELNKAYGELGTPNKEELKAIARGFKTALEDAGGPAIKDINGQLSYYGKIADSMVEKLAKGGPGLIQSLMVGGGIAGAPFTGGMSLLAPLLTGVSSTTVGKTATAQVLKGLGSLAGSSASQALGGQTMARGGNMLMELLTGKQSPEQNTQETTNQNGFGPAHTDTSISQGPKEGDLSPKGEWIYSEQSGDWMPNKQTKQGLDENAINEIALMDLLTTGGKNLSKIETMKSLFTDKSKTESQQAREQMGTLVDEADAMLKNNPNIKTGFWNLPIEQTKRKFNMGDQPTADFAVIISNLTATIAKARAGTSFTPNEQAMLERYAPKEGDSLQELKTKLAGLKKTISQK